MSGSVVKLGNDILIPCNSNSDNSITCKFVLLKNSSENLFIYGSLNDFEYHAQLVDNYCNLNNIPASWVRKPDLVAIFDNSVSIVGGGWMRIKSNDDKESIDLYGQSTAYGQFDKTTLNAIIKEDPFFHGKKIQINS